MREKRTMNTANTEIDHMIDNEMKRKPEPTRKPFSLVRSLSRKKQARLIVIAATLAAIGRWTPSLLAAEGLTIPTAWEGMWHLLATFLNMGMGVVEAFASAYIASALARSTGFLHRLVLLGLGVFAAITFVVVQTPYLMTQVTGDALITVLCIEYIGEHWLLAVWCASIVMATISIVAGVAYAEMGKIKKGR